MRRFRSRHIFNHAHNISKYIREKAICVQYGLKNKKEYARNVYTAHKYKVLFLNYANNHNSVILAKTRLAKLGIEKLSVESFLRRRLQTIVANKFNLSLYNARQVICHGKVSIKGVKCRHPSYLVYPAFENEVKLNINTITQI